MEVISSSETSVKFHRTTPRYIPEDRTGNSGHYEGVRKFMIDFKVAGLQAENWTQGVPTIKNSQQSEGDTHSIDYTYIYTSTRGFTTYCHLQNKILMRLSTEGTNIFSEIVL
jgi:hypothetical protein